LFFALFNLAPRGYGFSLTRLEAPLLTMLITMIAGVAVLWMIARLLPHTPLYGALRLAPTPSLGAGIALGDGTSEPLPGAKVGDQGIAVTDLRPSGTAEFNGRRADVLTRGEFIEQGQEITIEAIESHLVFVRTGAPKS
ncbi:NfeD family protein, partial [Candidatus Sumerlaeota bacterium]|nr:NfeD family protein [Candidatus Sumerlaeota bacterium]